ncbi:MAG TPA: response regulator [Polyangia bacterium]|nr:response regulator [Polyangia bacterium]
MFDNPGKAAESLGGIKILLADDEERLRTIVEMMLEELGAEVIVAGDGTSALEAFRLHTGGIGAVVLDLRMRGLGGVAVLERLRENDPTVPVLITSGAIPDDDVLERLLASGCGFIEKPFDLDGLAAALQAIIGGRAMVQRSR